MIAAVTAHDMVDHPPGFGGGMMFRVPNVQPLYLPAMPRFDHLLPMDGAVIPQRPLEHAGACLNLNSGLARNWQGHGTQWRSQQFRKQAAAFLPAQDNLRQPLAGGTQPQAKRPPGAPLSMFGSGLKRKNSRRMGSYMKKNKVEGGPPEGKAKFVGNGLGFCPPRLKDLQRRNRKYSRKYFPRPPVAKPASVPEAPRNTTSYIMQANEVKGRLSPALFGMPALSPSPWPTGTAGEELVEEAKELCVDPYGSMNGCIRLRSSDVDGTGDNHVDGEKDESSSESESTTSSGSVEQMPHIQVAPASSAQQLDARMDHGIRRFEMLYSADRTERGGNKNGDRFLQTRIEEQENQIAHLEEENLTLREKLFIAEEELRQLKRRSGAFSDENVEVDGACSAGEEASCAAAASRAASMDACP